MKTYRGFLIVLTALITLCLISGIAVGQDSIHIDSNGDVGIGTTTPGAKLDVRGDISGVSDITLSDTADSANYITGPVNRDLVIRTGNINSVADHIDFSVDTDTSGTVTVYETIMSITPAGNVGIGTTSPDYTLDVAGDADIRDELTAGTKSFKIDHPMAPAEKVLYHVAIEAPRNDLLYRGIAKLNSGKTIVNIDQASNMTSGTFASLTQNAEVVFLQNLDSFDRLRPGNIDGGSFKIICENPASSDRISWVVMAERNDPFIRNSKLCDENGKLITEVDKAELTEEKLSNLQDIIVKVGDASMAGERIEKVEGLGESKGFYLHPEAFGVKTPTRRVISVYEPK
jgi:hypothetical protein